MESPPAEAVKQSDGSHVLTLEDGSTMRWTRRLDGSWRKPEHKKAGFVGELEQQKYVVRGTARQAARTCGIIPGLPPGADASHVQDANRKAGNNKVKNPQESRVSEPAQAQDTASREPAHPVETSTAKSAETPLVVSETEKPVEVSKEKLRKGIEKKLRQITDLEAKKARGESLNEDQLVKLGAKDQLRAELFAIDNPGVPQEEPLEEPLVEPSEGPSGGSVAEEACIPVAIPSTQKGIEKKLRQIAELEARGRVERLNEDQLHKLQSKRALEEALSRLAGA